MSYHIAMVKWKFIVWVPQVVLALHWSLVVEVSGLFM